MIKNLFNTIVNSGVGEDTSVSDSRAIVLSNYVALIFALTSLLLFVIIPENISADGFLDTLREIVIFLLPILFNRFKLTAFSRIYLCWIPSVLIAWNMIGGMQQVEVVPASMYNGFRIYLVAYSCVPYLLIDRRKVPLFVLGVLPGFILTIFFDSVLEFFSVAPWQKGFALEGYHLMFVRILVAYISINGICFALKWIIDSTDKLNENLVKELQHKNEIIEAQAQSELSLLNQKLARNLEELTSRESALRASQHTAKVGSWEFSLRDKCMHWSDQMYEIFEVNERFNINQPDINTILFKDSAPVVRSVFKEILYDLKNADITLKIETIYGNVKWLRVIGYPAITNDVVTGANGIVHDITYFKEAEEKLLTTQKDYQSLFEQASDGILIIDFSGKILNINTSLCSVLGYEKEELLHMNVSQVLDPDHLKANPIKFKELEQGAHIVNERLLLNKSGARIPIEINAKKFGEHTILAMVRNISERKDTAQKLMKSIRELALLNTITTTAAKATDVPGLLTKVCEILHQEGGYRLVWIAQDPRALNLSVIKPIVSRGEATDYLDSITIDLENEKHRMGPTAQTLITCETHAINQISNDPSFDTWREKASRYGLNASLSMCINVKPVRYVLNVYSGNAYAFDQEEISILERIVANVGNTIRAISASQERDAAKRELQKTFERLNYHITHTPLAVIERDQDLKVTFWNKRAEELFGWTAEELLGNRTNDFIVHPDDQELLYNLIKEIRDKRLTSAIHERRNISKDGKILYCDWYYSIIRDAEGKLETILSFVSDVTEKHTANYNLNERIKELTTLYSVSRLLSDQDKSMEEVFSILPGLLPSGWQYPDICAVQLTVYGKEYYTSNFRTSQYALVEKLFIDEAPVGKLEVVYLEARKDEFEGPFFQEERHLLQVITEMLATFINRKRSEAELQQAQANLNATINNTEIMIWSVDRDMRLLSFNEPFRRFNKEVLRIEPTVGIHHRQYFDEAVSQKWDERYAKVLTGETVVLEETLNNIDYRFSLTPIIEKGQVIGVSAFADNITEQNRRSRSLAEADKKIAELKMMALKSVMNPHFLFNVLNSIQFFVASNERGNALTYLSTFSKLIRMVLNHSVATTITLAEELEMLRNYVALEKMRFNDKFDFILEIDNNIIPDDTRIPALLIQPYIENAILHGFYTVKKGGLITLRMKDMDEYLLVEIEDNGIGRKAAGVIRSKTPGGYKSVGTALTEERLRLINEQAGAAVEITDLYMKEVACGTRVTIRIKSY